MTFAEWNNQLTIPFEEWFLQEWGNEELKLDERVSKYIIRNLQEVSVQVKRDILKDMFVSIFKIGERYFRIRWFYTEGNNLCTGPIEEVHQIKKNIEIEYYTPI